MIIQIDTREKPRAIQKILKDFKDNEVKFYSSKLYVGDYMNPKKPDVVVDRKQNLSEICANVGSSTAEHERFRSEIQRANEVGIKVVVLIEHGHGFTTLEDIQFWDNPRLKTSPKATSGEKLYKILHTMCKKYDMEVCFCDKKDTGRRIREILNDE
jgi:ERCC4-type nuclease